jgi:hypothetical protein
MANGLVNNNRIEQFSVVGYGLWSSPSQTEEAFFRGTSSLGINVDRPVNWSTLITSFGFRVETATESDVMLSPGALILVDYENNIELAQVEQSRPATYVNELRAYTPSFRFKSQVFHWVILTMLRATNEVFFGGSRHVQLTAQNFADARRAFDECVRGFQDAPLTTQAQLTNVGMTAWQGKWMALGDMHSKAIRYIEEAAHIGLGRAATSEVIELLQEASREFAIDFNSLWRKALRPISNEKRQRRKDLRRRKCEPDPIDRYLVCNWEKALHSMTAAQLTKHIEQVFGPKFRIPPQAVRQRRYRLGLWCDWEGHPGNKIGS